MDHGARLLRDKDFIAGLLFLAIGIAFALGSRNYNFGNSAMPGPGYFPFGLGLLTAVVGLVILGKAVLSRRLTQNAMSIVVLRPFLVVTGSVALFALALPVLGMMLALPLLVVTSASASDDFRWPEAILNAVFLTAGSWVIFVWGLGLIMPLWPWSPG